MIQNIIKLRYTISVVKYSIVSEFISIFFYNNAMHLWISAGWDFYILVIIKQMVF